MNTKEYYKPIIIKNLRVDGVAAESMPKGVKGKIVQKLFITSEDEIFENIATNMINLFLKYDASTSLNSLLVLIKPDNTAYVYTKFPLGFEGIIKKSCKKYELIYEKDIADINSIFFKDDVIDLNPSDGEKIFWLFRVNWHFGLFFDLSGKLQKENALKEMGYYYRKMRYRQIYKTIERKDFFAQMIEDGWFPFVTLMGNGFDKIILYYSENKKVKSTVDDLIDKFDNKSIDDIVNRWWQNPIISSKKDIIKSGIAGYLQKDYNGYVSAVKILSTELEGIIRISYFNDFKKNPNTNDLKNYIKDKGKNKFNSFKSLGFPDEFYDFLTGYIFKGFDLNLNNVPESRHSVAHGVAASDIYKREFVFKLILTIDQVYFYLGNK